MLGSIRSVRVTLTLFGLCGLAGHRPGACRRCRVRPVAAGGAQAAGGKDGPGGQAAKPTKPRGSQRKPHRPVSNSSPNRAMIHRGRLCRFGPRRRMIDAGSKSCGSTARAERSKIGVPGPMRSRVLQEALKLEPDSIAVARRLSRIYIGALGRPDLALEYGKRVLAAEPGDSETLSQLVEYYRKNDPPGAEVLLNEVLANPKLERARAGSAAGAV